MAHSMDKYEFDLVIKHYGFKGEPYYQHTEEKQKQELLEKLEFKTLSAREVIRKLLDYIND